MKIFELPNDIGINDFLKVLKNTVKEELLIHQKTSDSIYSLYSDSSINQAIDSIYCLDKSIYIPGYGINNKILRFI